METRKRLTDDFCQTLLENFQQYCQEQQQREDAADLITYLLDRELIPPVKVRKYTIIRRYEQLKNKTDWKKTEVVAYLADRFNISTRSIWNILRRSEK